MTVGELVRTVAAGALLLVAIWAYAVLMIAVVPGPPR